MRRQAMGVVGVAEDVRVLIAALPAQGVHLEGSASDVGIEAGELKAADVESYAYLSQFLLQNHGEQAAGLVCRRFEGDVEADSVCIAGESGLVEQGIGAVGRVFVAREIRIPGPMIRGQQALRQSREVAPQ